MQCNFCEVNFENLEELVLLYSEEKNAVALVVETE